MIVKELSLCDVDSFRNEVVEEMKNAKHNGLEDMVLRMELHYD